MVATAGRSGLPAATEAHPRLTWRWTWTLTSFALVLRLAVVGWAAARFPAAGDGIYYDTLARRLAGGAGYTWLWPDGAVTYAAHYPVGYPGLLALAYSLFGARLGVAMTANAVVGALGVFAMHRLALRATSGRRAGWAALAMAVHPALLPYTAAIMTEGITASLLVMAGALAAVAREASRPTLWRAGAGVAMGVATLVRPQCLLLAAPLGLLSASHGVALPTARTITRWASALLVTGTAAAVCLPWTIRNCVRMNRCALVSVNGGWNLLIGEQSTTGGWSEIVVPSECREVWSEAAKDTCFARAARTDIVRDPGRWIAKMPGKLAATFDYIGASPWYMHLSNRVAFDEDDKRLHGALETVVTRLLLLAALLRSARLGGPRGRARWIVAAVGALAAVTTHGWVAYVALAVSLALLGARALGQAPLLVGWTGVLIVLTAMTHAVFFGAGRYGLIVLPFVAALGFVGAAAPRDEAARGGRATPRPPEVIASRRNSVS